MQHNTILMKKWCLIILVLIVAFSCKNQSDEKQTLEKRSVEVVVPPPKLHFGVDLNQYEVEEKIIRKNETFGGIMEKNGLDYPEIYTILQEIKGKVDLKKLRYGKPYSLFYSKDSLRTLEYFVYHPDVKGYSLIKLRDSIYAEKYTKNVKTLVLQASGVIENSLYESMINSGLEESLSYYLADVYAWTIDFTRLQKKDRFKVIYTENFVDDTISIGVGRIKAAYFEHKGNPFYAFEFEPDPEKGIVDYFDQNAKNLRRAFLKAPVKFSRISSRYNLRRRIAYYGNKIRPHKGTDYAASIGTPILATANGTVVKASYTRGNGNYVMIKHNNIYATQYLHMKRRKVKVGDFVKQGDVIGWVGMTGNTSGPHVCYRFWKNGRQVDPYKQKLPEAEPISDSIKKTYLEAITSVKNELDCIVFENIGNSEKIVNTTINKELNDPTKKESNSAKRMESPNQSLRKGSK